MGEKMGDREDSDQSELVDELKAIKDSQAETYTPPETLNPSALYHSSAHRDIESLEPRAESIRDPQEGPVVFATPDKAYAAMFIVPAGDSWTARGRFSTEDDHGPWHMVINGRERFSEADKGGAIYSLPVDQFKSDLHRNMAGTEWASATPVKPTTKEEYNSGLVAMKALGVKVYFVDDPTFRSIRESPDHGHDIISQLVAEM